jgi:hypothetical protein
VAESLRPGGIYILGLHLVPPDASPECIERWRERRGRTEVAVDLRVVSFDRRKRIERLRVSLLVRRGVRQLRFRDEFPLRLYTAAKLDDQLSDTVFILQKRK